MIQLQDLSKQNLFDCVEQLDDLVVQKQRRTKFSKFCNVLHYQSADKTAKFLESEEEAVCNEATAISSEFTSICKEIFEKTQKYFREPTLRSEGSKRSSKCSRMRPQIELKMQDELEGQTEAHKKQQEVELYLKSLQIDEEEQKKVQTAKDKELR